MRKIIIVALCLSGAVQGYTQKKFFSEGTALVHLYFDDYFIDKSYWLKAFAKGKGPSSVAFDSLNDGTWGATPYSINMAGGGGVQFRLMRDLSLFREASRSKVFWNTGAGLRKFSMRSEGFSYYSAFFQRDTTKQYYSENEDFRLRQTYLEIYNSFRYELRGKLLRKMYGYAGVGALFSFAITSKIEDRYYKSDIKWNTPSQTWVPTESVDTMVVAKAKKMHTYDWTIPFGIGFIVSERAKLELGMEYFHRKRTSNPYPIRKYSEGAMFQMLIRFNL